MGVEHRFVQHVLQASGLAEITGRVIPTARNLPVRNLYRHNGFLPDGDNAWRWSRDQQAPSREGEILELWTA
jgi:predicted enzyme involved in methoxymalonyl-ACP biosynthesis